MTFVGLVYYVLDATRHQQHVKIGFTTNLAERLRALADQTMSQQRPTLIAIEADPLELERQRHQEFLDLRLHGEWFRYDEPLRQHIAELENPHGFLLDRPDLWQFAQGFGPVPAAPARPLPAPRSPSAGPAVPVQF